MHTNVLQTLGYPLKFISENARIWDLPLLWMVRFVEFFQLFFFLESLAVLAGAHQTVGSVVSSSFQKARLAPPWSEELCVTRLFLSVSVFLGKKTFTDPS